MGRLGWPELLMIFAVFLLLFGSTRLPALGSSLGSAIRNFKKGFSGSPEGEDPPPGDKKLSDGSSTSTTASTDKAASKQG